MRSRLKPDKAFYKSLCKYLIEIMVYAMQCNAFWSFGFPREFERIFKQTTHMGILVKSQ